MTDFVTAADGVRIAFEQVGSGPLVVLVHGFGSDRNQNWRAPGWYDVLNKAGYSVLALDSRGHGESEKPHNIDAYGEMLMAGDVASVIAVASVRPVMIMGYSMGGGITLRLAHERADLVSSMCLGGVGATYFTRAPGWRSAIADGLLIRDTDRLTPVQQMFRAFAAQPGKDVAALAACMRAPRDNLSRAELGAIVAPALVVCGSTDEVSGPAEAMATALSNGQAVTIPARDHMRTVGDKLYKLAVLKFLADRPK